MRRRSASGLVVTAFYATLIAGSVAAQAGDELGARDYLEIRQLMDRYTHILDHCTNSGYDYADLFTADGTFGVSSEWGAGAKIWFRGREELAAAGGGGPNGCRPQTGAPTHHINIDPVITPEAGGAHAISTLLVVTNDTDERGDIVHWQGGYEDTFVKTSAGWRFKSRVHVWPEIKWTDRPEDMPPRNIADE
jgi:hypothetical protein